MGIEKTIALVIVILILTIITLSITNDVISASEFITPNNAAAMGIPYHPNPAFEMKKILMLGIVMFTGILLSVIAIVGHYLGAREMVAWIEADRIANRQYSRPETEVIEPTEIIPPSNALAKRKLD